MSRRLPPHLAMPLTPTELREALGPFADRVEVTRVMWDKQGSTTPLSVTWHASEPELQGWPAGEQPTVWLRPVVKDQKAVVAQALLRDALPDLTNWLAAATEAPPTWKATRHERRWVLLPTGQLTVKDADGLEILDRERNGKGPFR